MAISGPGTVGDDLDRFVIGFKIGEIQVGEVRTFQFPKMTEEELEQWQRRETEFLSSFQVQPESSSIFFNFNEIEYIRFSGSRLTMLKETVSDSYDIYDSYDSTHPRYRLIVNRRNFNSRSSIGNIFGRYCNIL